MKYLFIILFMSIFLANAAPSAPQKKEKKQKQQTEQTTQTEQTEQVVSPAEIPEEKTPEEIEEEKMEQIVQKWKKYLPERISEVQQLFDEISQLDSNTITKEMLEEYHIAVNNLKEKVDFKLGNDPLWKENDELDDMRALFSETHARTINKLKYWDEKIVPPKKTNKLVLIGMALLGIMAIVPIFTQIKSALTMKNAKKQAAKLLQQQQKEAEKRALLADENNIINIE